MTAVISRAVGATAEPLYDTVCFAPFDTAGLWLDCDEVDLLADADPEPDGARFPLAVQDVEGPPANE